MNELRGGPMAKSRWALSCWWRDFNDVTWWKTGTLGLMSTVSTFYTLQHLQASSGGAGGSPSVSILMFLKLFLVGAVLSIRAHFFQPLQELRFNNSYRWSSFIFLKLLKAKGPRTFMTPMATHFKVEAKTCPLFPLLSDFWTWLAECNWNTMQLKLHSEFCKLFSPQFKINSD